MVGGGLAQKPADHGSSHLAQEPRVALQVVLEAHSAYDEALGPLHGNEVVITMGDLLKQVELPDAAPRACEFNDQLMSRRAYGDRLQQATEHYVCGRGRLSGVIDVGPTREGSRADGGRDRAQLVVRCFGEQLGGSQRLDDIHRAPRSYRPATGGRDILVEPEQLVRVVASFQSH